MNLPARVAFSQKYRSREIRGAFGLSDHGFCEKLDMTQKPTMEGDMTLAELGQVLGEGSVMEEMAPELERGAVSGL